MELSIHVHGFDLTPRLQNYVEKKAGRLDRYMSTLTEVRVDLSEQKASSIDDRQVAQLTVRDSRGTILRAEERNGDMFAAIDAVVDKMYRRINRYRGKRLDKRRGSGAVQEEFVSGEPVPLDLDESDEMDEEPVVIRRKQFSLQPMGLDEAGEQMELLGHDFFVFVDRETEMINVLYRRRDGNYGLLQPEVK